jgi:hypothetical protein
MAAPSASGGRQQLDYLVENAGAIHTELKNLEQSIYDLETRYLESTTTQGNIFRGWEAYLDTKLTKQGAPLKKNKVTEGDRHFSKSSVTSPLHCNNAVNTSLGHTVGKGPPPAVSHKKKSSGSHKRSHKKQRTT